VTVNAQKKLLRVNLEGLTKQIELAGSSAIDRQNDADFRTKLRLQGPPSLSGLRESNRATRSVSGCNWSSMWKHEVKKQLTQQDLEALWLSVKER